MDEGARGDAEADDEAERDIFASSERKKKAKKKIIISTEQKKEGLLIT